MNHLVAALTFHDLGQSLREAFFMFWETLWALVLGFGLSGAVQAFVSRSEMERLLGRGGVMHLDLVTSPEHIAGVMGNFQALISGFEYQTGYRYAEWRQGDRVAEYGLTALVAGGAGVALLKSGLLAKFWKLIVAGIAALVAGIRRFWRRITGRNNEVPQS